MSNGGEAQGGGSASGPSQMFQAMPYGGYRELPEWYEEYIDALGTPLDSIYQRFGTAAARANLLNPTYTPPNGAENYFATATAAPLQATGTDSMLDVLAFIALCQYPLNTKFTVAQKQALVQVGWNLVRRKGVRQYLLQLAAAATGGVVYGWTSPGVGFSFVVPDGFPSPGQGSWSPSPAVQTGTLSTTSGSTAVVGAGTAFTSNWVGYTIIVGTNAYIVASVTNATNLVLSSNASATVGGSAFSIVTGASERPWSLSALRGVVTKFFPAWASLGIGYSQFRAGYSGAGEPAMVSGSRLGILANESFSAWAAGTATGWANTSLTTQSALATGINYEFSNYAAVIDLTAKAAGVSETLSQSCVVNNQITHQLQVDYSYTNAQSASVLVVKVFDVDNQVYYNAATGTWTSGARYTAVAPVSSSRGRYTLDIPFQAASQTASTIGTTNVTVSVSVTSDGTTTTQTTYTIFRVGLYEKFDATIEAAAQGERTLWIPCRDALGWTSFTRAAGGGTMIEPATYNRGNYKSRGTTGSMFDYHPALGGRGFHANGDWTNLLFGSNDFGADWTLTSATKTANAIISPLVGETVATASSFAATAKAAGISQGSLGTPTSKTYVGGVWVKKTSADVGNQAGTITITAGSTSVTGSGTSFDASWVNHSLVTANGSYKVSAVGGATSLTLSAVAGRTETAVSFSLTDVKIELISTATYSVNAVVPTSTAGVGSGWKLIPFNITLGGGDVAALSLKISWGAASSGQAIGLASSYLYDVTANPGVLYPPVCQTPIGASAPVKPTQSQALTNITGSDVLHPLLRRSLVSVARGGLQMTVVPTFDGPSQPACVIFDVANTFTVDRVKVEITAGTLQVKRWDNAGHTSSCALTLVKATDPSSSQVTWRRDTSITIRVRWDANGQIYLSAGTSNAQSTIPGTWTTTEDAVSIGIGSSFSLTFPFDGLIRDVEVIQIGAPTT